RTHNGSAARRRGAVARGGFGVGHRLQDAEAGGKRHDAAQLSEAKSLERLPNGLSQIGCRQRTHEAAVRRARINGLLRGERGEVPSLSQLLEHALGVVLRLDNDDAEADDERLLLLLRGRRSETEEGSDEAEAAIPGEADHAVAVTVLDGPAAC